MTAETAERIIDEDPAQAARMFRDGDMATCIRCGKPFIVTAWRQILCPQCGDGLRRLLDARRKKHDRRKPDGCIVCGKPLDAYRHVGGAPIYCSPVCRAEGERARQRKRKRRNTCPVCGKPCPAAEGRGRTPRVYCSPECKAEAERRRRQAAHDARMAAQPDRVCPVCGKAFKPRLGGTPQRYCSPVCNRRAAHGRERRPAREPRRCVQCGRVFQPAGCGWKRATCSPECARAHRNERMRRNYHRRMARAASAASGGEEA